MYTIFSIDNWDDPHTLAKFTRHIDTQKAMGKMSGEMVIAIGCYEGQLELSFIMMTMDFNKFVRGSGYVDNQISFMEVGEYHKQPAILHFKDHSEVLGKLVATNYMPMVNAWTYRPDINKYWSL